MPSVALRRPSGAVMRPNSQRRNRDSKPRTRRVTFEHAKVRLGTRRRLPMQTRTLGHTTLNVSRIALGTMTFGKQVDERTAASMIDTCLERGVNFIDTANVYNAGASETIVGRLLRSRRDKVVLATKVGIKVGERPQDAGLSRSAIHNQIEESLRRLQTDYVDVYYL